MSTRETQACGRDWDGPTLAPSHDARGGRSRAATLPRKET